MTSRSLMRILLIAATLPLLGSGAPPNGDAAPGADSYVSNQLIVRMHPGAEIEAIHAKHGTVEIASLTDHNIHLLQLPSHVSEHGLLQILATNQNVQWVELNISLGISDGSTQSFFFGLSQGDYAGQWMLHLLKPELAHADATGEGIVIALLDTAVDQNHELLLGRLLPAQEGFLIIGDGGTADADDGPLAGHGTFMAGLLATIAPDAMILPIEVLDSFGSGDTFGAAAGILHAVDSGAKVINVSLGTEVQTQILDYAVENATNASAIVVAAAGNKDSSEPVEFPAAHPASIAVSATDSDDIKSSFSNFGAHIDLSAPGTQLISAFPGPSGNDYAMSSGTSAAATLVSGAAALLASLDPAIEPDAVRHHLTSSAVSTNESNPEHVDLLGAGRLDVVKCVADHATPIVPADLNGDGAVNVFDLLILLAAWGNCSECTACAADLTQDCTVDVFDLLALLSAWGG